MANIARCGSCLEHFEMFEAPENYRHDDYTDIGRLLRQPAPIILCPPCRVTANTRGTVTTEETAAEAPAEK